MADETKQKNEGKPLTDKDLEGVSGGIIIQSGRTAAPATRTVDGGVEVDGGITQPGPIMK